MALLRKYNDKPVLTRPQHRFWRGPGYLEIDVDVHAYAYIARKAFNGYVGRLASVVFENAFVIQGNRCVARGALGAVHWRRCAGPAMRVCGAGGSRGVCALAVR